ncbi:MAG: bifunctional pyr operon transcriptional regulator/uracil phosphoribosyltransferase [Tenericutes bacterium GWC2_34_14]|nr:MAG: bifunctional pyr operon transcriptional regulator/uracil phosphoribosyltransferase [Tenericutes bacterium GWA2_35_7]OHE29007.1 MAG: bifunctional pyr operon transcriptional regulator/uracil phosphoribosyltransferase [Tenericutes bacterium GWC2_34_14]OHE33960.1 MAG: bifunctional pyr operon transcriptional regulator/uracil phosphoribosyltransferase [Tenericutes bacterium GWE2_34_108]OHE35293.1 MAG: bifunctional pyr operon transcriptional regulator/uracil phosphoribosyltransferase [Tenericut
MKELMNQEQLSRTMKRMTHEIIERNQDLSDIVLVGILKKGFPLANILKENLKRFADVDVPVYALSIHAYRDDLENRILPQKQHLQIHDKTVILVDDVLYTGRSVRAAMDALSDHGRPKNIQLAILIDRGHRELPIRADYIGKNIPTSRHEKVMVDMEKMSVCVEEITDGQSNT